MKLKTISDYEEELEKAHEEMDRMRERLEEAADVMAEVGSIHNTPYAKLRWIEGR